MTKPAPLSCLIPCLVSISCLAACSFTGREISASADDGGPADVDAGVAPDASSSVDSPSSNDASSPGLDAEHAVTLSDTSPDLATEAAAGCINSTSGAIYDGQWYRVFALSDPHWGVAGALTVTDVAIAVWKAQGASNVKVTIGTYGGTYPAATLAPSMFAALAEVDPSIVNVSAGASTALVHVPISVVVPAGRNLAVKISASNGLELGATSAAPYQGGFFGSSMCAYSPPIASAGFIVAVSGTE